MDKIVKFKVRDLHHFEYLDHIQKGPLCIPHVAMDLKVCHSKNFMKFIPRVIFQEFLEIPKTFRNFGKLHNFKKKH